MEMTKPPFFDHMCVICGLLVLDRPCDSPEFWLSRYRIIHWGHRECAVSGVGVYSRDFGNVYGAPLNPSRRRKANDGRNPGYKCINGNEGYVFHESCWELLNEFFKPEKIPTTRLWDICRSMPPFGTQQVEEALGAASDYYGSSLDLWEVPESFVWRDALVEKEDDSLADPFNVHLIGNLLEEASKKSIKEHPFSAISSTPKEKSVMEKLPQETCDRIAHLLPKSDLFNLRLASRSFAYVFWTQSFWASRFKLPNEKGHWLFESHKIDKPGYNWRWLCESTTGSENSMVFSNRKRVWKTVNLIKDIMSLKWKENFCHPSKHADFDKRQSVAAWRNLDHILSKDEISDSSHRCCCLYSHKAEIPASVCRFKFSFAKMSKVSYITGIGFTSSQGVVSEMGYWADEDQVFTVEVTGFKGFIVALDSYGVRAIRVKQDQPNVSEWIGCPDDCPKTMNLVTSGDITALEVQYDGWKVVGLVLDTNQSTLDLPAEQRPRREVDVWIPDIPEKGLLVSDFECYDMKCFFSDYPTHWVLFGGRGGVYLRNLTGVTVNVQDNHISLQFTYNTDQIPPQSYNLGPIKTGIDFGLRRNFHFPIDGPSGEVITELEVYMPIKSIYNQVNVHYGFKISTNKGRSCFIPISSYYNIDITTSRQVIVPGTITGIYIIDRLGDSLLGVISEVIHG